MKNIICFHKKSGVNKFNFGLKQSILVPVCQWGKYICLNIFFIKQQKLVFHSQKRNGMFYNNGYFKYGAHTCQGASQILIKTLYICMLTINILQNLLMKTKVI